MEGLHLEIADWHAGNKFVKVQTSPIPIDQ